MRIFASEEVFSFPCELRTSPRVPTNLNDGNTALLELLYFTIHNFNRFFYKVQFVIEFNFFERIIRFSSAKQFLRAENEMLRIRLRAVEEKAEYNHIETEYYKNRWARMSWYYDDLSGWEVRDNAVRTDAASDRGGESVDTTAVVKDVREEKDDKGDDVAAKDPQPLESRGSPRDP
ncbi:hypothetical protein Tco_1376506 [Tanacetum coccineum]